MAYRPSVIPARNLAILEERIDQARNTLQYTEETDPSFERRLTTLLELVGKRERVLSDSRRPYLPPRQPGLAAKQDCSLRSGPH